MSTPTPPTHDPASAGLPQPRTANVAAYIGDTGRQIIKTDVNKLRRDDLCRIVEGQQSKWPSSIVFDATPRGKCTVDVLRAVLADVAHGFTVPGWLEAANAPAKSKTSAHRPTTTTKEAAILQAKDSNLIATMPLHTTLVANGFTAAIPLPAHAHAGSDTDNVRAPSPSTAPASAPAGPTPLTVSPPISVHSPPAPPGGMDIVHPVMSPFSRTTLSEPYVDERTIDVTVDVTDYRPLSAGRKVRKHVRLVAVAAPGGSRPATGDYVAAAELFTAIQAAPSLISVVDPVSVMLQCEDDFEIPLVNLPDAYPSYNPDRYEVIAGKVKLTLYAATSRTSPAVAEAATVLAARVTSPPVASSVSPPVVPLTVPTPPSLAAVGAQSSGAVTKSKKNKPSVLWKIALTAVLQEKAREELDSELFGHKGRKDQPALELWRAAHSFVVKYHKTKMTLVGYGDRRPTKIVCYDALGYSESWGKAVERQLRIIKTFGEGGKRENPVVVERIHREAIAPSSGKELTDFLASVSAGYKGKLSELSGAESSGSDPSSEDE